MESNDIWRVQFSGRANQHLSGILEYLLDRDEAEFALELLKLIRAEGKARLQTLPKRGRVVPELETVTTKYREIRVKSYRLIYRAVEDQRTVRILVVAHVKQDIQELLLTTLIQ